MRLSEIDLLPQYSRVVAISNTMKKSLVLKAATGTNSRLSQVSVVEQGKSRHRGRDKLISEGTPGPI